MPAMVKVGEVDRNRWSPVGLRVVIRLVPLASALIAAGVAPSSTRGESNPAAAPAPTAKRIITIAPNSAEIICALGACDAIIGVSKFCVHPPELKGRPHIGGLFDPDLEKIVALRPDLVVLRGQSESVERLCRQRGISIYHDKTDTLAGVENCIVELGRLLGRSNEATAMVEKFRGRVEAVRKRTANRPRPRVLLTVSRQPDRLANLLTAGRGTFLTEMLNIAGGVNIFGNLDIAYPQVSLESIVARRPEVILELMPEVELTPARKQQMVEQWRAIGSLPAVTEGRVFFLTDDHCLIPSPRYVEIIEKVSRLLHPEAANDP